MSDTLSDHSGLLPGILDKFLATQKNYKEMYTKLRVVENLRRRILATTGSFSITGECTTWSVVCNFCYYNFCYHGQSTINI